MGFRSWTVVPSPLNRNRPLGARFGLQSVNNLSVDLPSMTEILALPEDGFFPFLGRTDESYETMKLEKSDGTIRYISSPLGRLRKFQFQFLKHFLAEPGLAHSAAFAYVRGKSAVQCARVHEDADWLIKIDLKDFFHSIDERQIYREFRRRGVAKYRSFVMARLLTRSPEGFEGPLPRKYRMHRPHSLSKKFGVRNKRLGFLPQGSPTSGAISNIVCFDLDNALEKISAQRSLRYTRYADDIVMSGTGQFNRLTAENTLREVLRTVEKFGFRANTGKTRIIPPGARLKVLGVLVGKPGLRLPREKRSQIDNHLRGIQKFGFKTHSHRLKLKDEYALLNLVVGNLVWAHEVNSNWARPRLARLRRLTIEQLGEVKDLS